MTPPLNLHSPRSLGSTDPAPGYEAPGGLGSGRRPVHFVSENIDEGGPYGSRVSGVVGHARGHDRVGGGDLQPVPHTKSVGVMMSREARS